MILHNLADVAASQWPDRIAVSQGPESVTHGQIAAASLRVAAWLRGMGVDRGQCVALAGPPSALVPALIYGGSRVGAVICVLHEQTRGEALRHVLSDAVPAVLIAADDDGLRLARDHGVRAVPVGQARKAAFTGAMPASANPWPAPLPVDPVFLIYTSGTTDRPKAVVSTHQQVMFSVQAIQSVLEYRPGDIVGCPLPLSFDYGMYQLFLGSVSGAHVRLLGATEAGPALLRDLSGNRATVLAAVPGVADSLARLLRRRPQQPPPLRLLTSTGSTMSQQVLAELRATIPGLRVQLMYGLTECKRAAIMPPDADLERPGASGLALPGTEIFAIDADGERLPAGEIGELVVRGPNVMAGYWRRPELTAQRFPRERGLFPQLRTGDSGWLDKDGYVYFAGRSDDVYKERGFRISAVEVEAAARRVPRVRQAAVLRPADGRPATLVVAGDISAPEVVLAMRDQIEEFKIPERCVVLDAVPATLNGKVDRAALALRVSRD
jgi:acyl-CoA synthetase (AMP-forming)/AMP-acid ligase II